MAKKFKKLFIEKLEIRRSMSPLFALPRVKNENTMPECSGKSFKKPSEGGVSTEAISEKGSQYTDKPIDVVLKYAPPNPDPIVLKYAPPNPDPIVIKYAPPNPGPVDPIVVKYAPPDPGPQPLYAPPDPGPQPLYAPPDPGPIVKYAPPNPGPIDLIVIKYAPPNPDPIVIKYAPPNPGPIRPILSGQFRILEFFKKPIERFFIDSPMVRKVSDWFLQILSSPRTIANPTGNGWDDNMFGGASDTEVR